MANIKIDVINQTKEASNNTIGWLTAALQKQVSRDFAPVWGVDADLRFVAPGMTPNPHAWQLVFLTDADMAGALGYHDLTAHGLPLGKVFVRTTEQAKDAWSVTASHELLEMLADPNINLTSLLLNDDGVTGRAYAYEVCDACEMDSLGYVINDFKVSDFVYPNWFEQQATASFTKYDFMGHLAAPFQLLAGGYIGVFDIPNHQGWQQLFADRSTADVAPQGTRRELRKKPLTVRQVSSLVHGE